MGSDIENKINSIEKGNANNNIESAPIIKDIPNIQEQKIVKAEISVNNNNLPPNVILSDSNPVASLPTQEINSDNGKILKENEVKVLYSSHGTPCQLTNGLSDIYKKSKKIE